MALGVDLRDEHGRLLERLPIDQFALERALPEFDNEAYPHLRLIDPYGNTTFGRVQNDGSDSGARKADGRDAIPGSRSGNRTGQDS